MTRFLNPQYCNTCGAYADHSSYCNECFDKLKQEIRKGYVKLSDVIEILNKYTYANCVQYGEVDSIKKIPAIEEIERLKNG